MPSVRTISFVLCNASRAFEPLTQSEDPSSLPFLRLKRVIVLGTELRLKEMARRRDLGVPLKTLIIGRIPKVLAELEELVDGLRVGFPVEID